MDSPEDFEPGGVEGDLPCFDSSSGEDFEGRGVSVVGFSIKDKFHAVVDNRFSTGRTRKRRDG